MDDWKKEMADACRKVAHQADAGGLNGWIFDSLANELDPPPRWFKADGEDAVFRCDSEKVCRKMLPQEGPAGVSVSFFVNDPYYTEIPEQEALALLEKAKPWPRWYKSPYDWELFFRCVGPGQRVTYVRADGSEQLSTTISDFFDTHPDYPPITEQEANALLAAAKEQGEWPKWVGWKEETGGYWRWDSEISGHWFYAGGDSGPANFDRYIDCIQEASTEPISTLAEAKARIQPPDPMGYRVTTFGLYTTAGFYLAFDNKTVCRGSVCLSDPDLNDGKRWGLKELKTCQHCGGILKAKPT